MANPVPVTYSAGSGEKCAGGKWVTPCTIDHDVECANVSPELVTVSASLEREPVVWLDVRPGVNPWRHIFCAVDGVRNKRPVFRINRATRVSSDKPGSGWLPCYTTNTYDIDSWVMAPSITLVGGTTGYIEFQFAEPLPGGRIYLATHPLGTQADAGTYAAELLSAHPSVAAPCASADANGVYYTSPAEVDDIGRQVGGNPLYAIRLAWGGPTNDGRPKRKLVMLGGIHAAGEHTSWLCFIAWMEFVLGSADAAAVAIRANWDIYLYFNLNPNGIVGGSRRTTFRVSTDPNRAWSLSTAAVLEIGATQTAILSDTGGSADMLQSWHCWSAEDNPFLIFFDPPNGTPPRSTAAQALVDIGTDVFGRAPSVTTSGTSNTDAWWGVNALGCRVGCDSEVPQNGATAPSAFRDIGVKWAQILYQMDAAGVFYTG